MYIAAPMCEVTVRAISAEMITCEAECSNTRSMTFSSNVPGNNDVQTCGGQSTSPTILGSRGKLLIEDIYVMGPLLYSLAVVILEIPMSLYSPVYLV